MRFVIITGMSGAGKTQVMHFMEDIGYYCIDNIPLPFLLPFAKMCYTEENDFENVAVVIDSRGGEMLKEVGKTLDEFHDKDYEYEILFLESNENVLVKRFKETRRSHPLANNGSIENGISKEREYLSFLRGQATHIIDTSSLLTRDLRSIIIDLYAKNDKTDYFKIQVQSFGFKYGMPYDADLVFDVRFLPNPFYIDELKNHNGTEEPVQNFVMNFTQSKDFLNKLFDMLKMLIPHYIEEGKTELVIAIGCTGGCHRSVAIAEALSKKLASLDYKTFTRHRDIKKS